MVERMHRLGHGRVKNAILFLVGTGMLGLVAVNGAAPPKKVTFSSSSTNDIMPSVLERERQLERIKNASGRSPSVDDVPDKPFSLPSNTEGPTTFHNKKLQQMLDRRSNWIFVTEDVDAKQPTAEELFGVGDSKALQESGKPKGVIEKYFEKNQKDPNLSGKNSENRSENRSDNRSKDSLDSWDKANSATGPEDPLSNPGSRSRNSLRGKDKEAGADNHAYSDAGRVPGASDANPSLNPEGTTSTLLSTHRSGLMTTREERLRQDKLQSDQRYYQLFHPGATQPGLAAGGPNDPINQMVDTTRNPLQPTTAPTLTDLDVVGNSKANNPFAPSPNSGFSGRQGNMDTLLGGRVFGSSSLSPSFMAPSAPALVQPKPAVLEVPRRKF